MIRLRRLLFVDPKTPAALALRANSFILRTMNVTRLPRVLDVELVADLQLRQIIEGRASAVGVAAVAVDHRAAFVARPRPELVPAHRAGAGRRRHVTTGRQADVLYDGVEAESWG